MGILSAFFGKQAEPIIPAVHVDWEAKFKAAAKDLAAQSDEIAVLKDAVEQAEAQADTLRPDALKWRARASREQKRGQAKRKAA